MYRAVKWLGNLALLALSAAPMAQASPVNIALNTSGFTGTSALLAFDLIDGGLPANTVTVFSFSTDGTLGSITLTGDVSGSLPGTVILGDTQFFNEYLQAIVLGTTINFSFNATDNFDPASLPDAFSFFLLDAATGLPLYATADPTGANALFQYDVGQSDPLHIYSTTVTEIPNQAPEPGTSWLFAIGLLIAWVATRRRAALRRG
jgi:hypothetical protein